MGKGIKIKPKKKDVRQVSAWELKKAEEKAYSCYHDVVAESIDFGIANAQAIIYKAIHDIYGWGKGPMLKIQNETNRIAEMIADDNDPYELKDLYAELEKIDIHPEKKITMSDKHVWHDLRKNKYDKPLVPGVYDVYYVWRENGKRVGQYGWAEWSDDWNIDKKNYTIWGWKEQNYFKGELK